jgi:hypothetical protein
MKKWIRRLALFAVGLVLVLVLSAAGLYFLGVRRSPEWLRKPITSAAELAAAATRVEEKLRDTVSVVGEMNSYVPPATQTTSPTDTGDRRPVSTQPPRPLKLEVTEDEINALFTKWDRLYGWTNRFKDYVQDPSIVLHEGRIILAGRSEELSTVISVHFEPRLDEKGQLNLELSKVLAGRLPLPQSFFEKYRNSARRRLESALPGLQRKAKIDKDGTANTEAMSAAMAKLFLHVLADRPGESVLFVPLVKKGSVPVRLTDVKIADKSLFLTVKPLNAAERVTLLERIREPYDRETAMNADARPARRPDAGS